MKAAFLVKYGDASSAFEIREVPRPKPKDQQVLIEVEAFGLNFADVMARLGLYKAAPPLPSLLGYDVVGTIVECGPAVTEFQTGDRVTALTRFGGYAEFAVAESSVLGKIPPSMPAGVATALSTQYCTAFFLARELANVQAKDQVLVHAAAGGVGTALVQIAKHQGCEVFGTCSSAEKVAYLRDHNVDHPINYRQHDFAEKVTEILGNGGLDVIFDPVGGKSVKKGFRLLGAGGRILTYGVSSMNQAKSVFGKLHVLGQFGFYHPVQFLSKSRGMIGVNMLTIADQKPHKISRVMKQVISMTEAGILQPHVGGEYPAEHIGDAHAHLESRKSMGKIIVKW
ncbi:MAG: zinc-binding dehydrogenase [Saprospiraceae bacterium]|nr:zinc-binding dehydrogenase [Saprospiraceae bacterium]